MAIVKRSTTINAAVRVEDEQGDSLTISYEEGAVFVTAYNSSGDAVMITIPWDEWTKLVGTVNTIHWMEQRENVVPESTESAGS